MSKIRIKTVQIKESLQMKLKKIALEMNVSLKSLLEEIITNYIKNNEK